MFDAAVDNGPDVIVRKKIIDRFTVAAISDELGLLKDPKLCVRYGTAAYEQMSGLWNPAVAARNVLTLADDLSSGRPCSIKEGPCSRAGILKNNWYS